MMYLMYVNKMNDTFEINISFVSIIDILYIVPTIEKKY